MQRLCLVAEIMMVGLLNVGRCNGECVVGLLNVGRCNGECVVGLLELCRQLVGLYLSGLVRLSKMVTSEST